MSKESPREYAVGYAIFADENEARRALEDVNTVMATQAGFVSVSDDETST